MPQPGVEVLNENPLGFPVDVKVAVMNRNPEKAVLRFDGYDYEFEPNEAAIVDTQAAFALFAVDTRTQPGHTIKCRRDKTFGPGGNSNSFYNECLIKYGAANSAKGREWFDNFDFKLVKSTKKMAAVDFDKLTMK
jgi:hypothetical protein